MLAKYQNNQFLREEVGQALQRAGNGGGPRKEEGEKEVLVDYGITLKAVTVSPDQLLPNLATLHLPQGYRIS